MAVMACRFRAGRFESRWRRAVGIGHDAARPCLHQDDLARLLALTKPAAREGS